MDHTKNCKTKNSRQAWSMAQGTKFGRQALEAAGNNHAPAMLASIHSAYRVTAWTSTGRLLITLITSEQAPVATT